MSERESKGESEVVRQLKVKKRGVSEEGDGEVDKRVPRWKYPHIVRVRGLNPRGSTPSMCLCEYSRFSSECHVESFWDDMYKVQSRATEVCIHSLRCTLAVRTIRFCLCASVGVHKTEFTIKSEEEEEAEKMLSLNSRQGSTSTPTLGSSKSLSRMASTGSPTGGHDDTPPLSVDAGMPLDDSPPALSQCESTVSSKASLGANVTFNGSSSAKNIVRRNSVQMTPTRLSSEVSLGDIAASRRFQVSE